MGKGTRCDAVAEHSVANPTRFFETPRYGFAVRIPLPLTVPRGEQMGKGTRCDASAELSVANPARFIETPRYGFAVRIPLTLIVPLRRAEGKGHALRCVSRA